MRIWACGSGSGGSNSGDLPGWSGRQARQGVQPASVAAARVILSRSLSPMKRMRMQRALWYLGTPGTTVTSMAGSGPAGSAWPACLSCSGCLSGSGCLSCSGCLACEVAAALTTVVPGTSVSSGSTVRSAPEAGPGSPGALGSGAGSCWPATADEGSAVSSARDGAGFWVGWGDVGGAGVWSESSRHSHTPGAEGSRCGVNAAGARGVSAGRGPGGVAGRKPARDGPDGAAPAAAGAGTGSGTAACGAEGCGAEGCGAAGSCALDSTVPGWAVLLVSSRQLTAAPMPSASRATPLTPIAM